MPDILNSRIENKPAELPVAGIPERPVATPKPKPVNKDRRKHYIIPDLQLQEGVPTEHLAWIGQDIAKRRPDVIINMGDTWDMPSLSFHDLPGSASKEGARYDADIKSGMDGLALLMAPIQEAMKATGWRPRLVYLEGNHEYRIARTIEADPRYTGRISMQDCNVEAFGFERFAFLHVAEIDGISYSHYFQMAGSNRPIGGSMDNRLNKICTTFVQGHEQGLLQHRRPLPVGRTIHGIVAGSAYLHSEDYRGPQRNNEWRGTVVLNDVRNGGDCDPMPLTIQYLARTYGNCEVYGLLESKYADLPREWAR